MYYLYDLMKPQGKNLPVCGSRLDWPANPMQLDDKAALMDFWARRVASSGFEMLNVTGKDVYIHTAYIRDTIPGPRGNFGVTAVEERRLKPYLVVDDEGRHVDIRDWGMKPERICHDCPGSRAYDSVMMGSKQHRHRMNGPSMRRRTLRIHSEERCAELDETLIRVPGVRKKVLAGCWDEMEFYRNRKSSRSWKDQCKAANQFAKRKPGCRHRGKLTAPEDNVWSSLMAAGFPVSPAAMEA